MSCKTFVVSGFYYSDEKVQKVRVACPARDLPKETSLHVDVKEVSLVTEYASQFMPSAIFVHGDFNEACASPVYARAMPWGRGYGGDWSRKSTVLAVIANPTMVGKSVVWSRALLTVPHLLGRDDICLWFTDEEDRQISPSRFTVVFEISDASPVHRRVT